MGLRATVSGTVTTMVVPPNETIIIKAGANQIILSGSGITIQGNIELQAKPSIKLTGPSITADKILVG